MNAEELLDSLLPLKPTILAETVDAAKDLALGRGFVIRRRDAVAAAATNVATNGGALTDVVTFLPFSLLPSPWPRSHFDVLSRLQRDINLIYYRVANDFDFLRKSLKQTCEADPWTRRLWALYERTYDRQKHIPSLALLRSDYMIDNRSGNPKQIEVNTLSAAFGGVSSTLLAQQRHLVARLGYPELRNFIPENKALRLANGLAQAWHLYGKPDAVICFVLEDVVCNVYDQRQLEWALSEKFGVAPHLIVRRANIDLLKARLNANNELILAEGTEVAVVYMRTWYDPTQLDSDDLWSMRERVESSRSIKCANLGWQLAGCKKIQQELARPGCLEQFCDDLDQAARVRSVFAGLYAMEETETYENVMKNPRNYVLKPQKEGGGHNIYGENISDFLSKLPANRRQEFIAMEMVPSRTTKGYLVNEDNIVFSDIVNELGIFGYVLGTSEKLLRNEIDCGWILRAKNVSSSEGGVAAGYGYLNCPVLI